MTDEAREKARARQKRYRERRKALGLKDPPRDRPPRTEEQRRQNTKNMRRYRAEARAQGMVLAADQWGERNPERVAENARRWREENLDRHRENCARWRQENPDLCREYDRRWREKNPDHTRKIGREKQARRRTTPWGKINDSMWRTMTDGMRRRNETPGKYNFYLGYTWAELHDHLEAQFEPGMTWKNWGDVWELDHIKPVSSFHYTSLEDPLFRKAWRLSNLRPLWRFENGSKGKRILPKRKE